MAKIPVKLWILIVAIIGFSLTGLLYQNLQIAKSQHIDSIVTSTSEHYRKILQAKLSSLFREMEIAQHLYQNSPVVNTQTFKIIAQPMVNRPNGLVALEWIPRIAQNKLQQHHKTALASGFKNYFVKEKSFDGNFVAVQARPYYYPIYLSEPASNNTAQGYDIGSNPDRLSALLKAMEKNVTVATVPLTLLHNELPYDGFLVFKPVYQHAKSIETTEARITHLKGFIVGVFSTKALINSAFEFIDQPTNSISLNDVTEPISYNAAKQLLNTKNNVLTRSSILPIADHNWKLSISFQESTINNSTISQPIIALFSGLFLTAILAFYIYIVSSHMNRTKQTIITQTSNQQKNDQIKRTILNTVNNAVITVSAEGFIESINKAAEDIFGYQTKEVVGKNISIFIPDSHSKHHDQYIRQYFRTGKSKAVGNKRSVEGRHKRGHKVKLEMTITEISTHNKASFCVVAQDMSNLIETAELSNRLLEITRISPDFIATFDAEGHLVFANDAARKALGYAALEDITQRRLDSIFPGAANDFFQKSRRYPDYLHSWTGESIFVTAQGQATSVSQLLLSHPCHANETQYYTAFMRDITEDKKTQFDLRNAQKAVENVSDTRQQKLDAIIDNIRGPLGNIFTTIERLHETDLSAAQRQYVTDSHSSELQLKAFLRDPINFHGFDTHYKMPNGGSSNDSKYADFKDPNSRHSPISNSGATKATAITSHTACIDSQILNSLKETMSNTDYKNMLPQYVSDTEKNIETMCTACKENHYQEIEQIAHQIKSSSATIGINNLSVLADTLEHDIQENHLEKISLLISSIQDEFSVVKDHLHNEYIAQNKAS